MPLTSACCRPPAPHGQAGPGADSEPCQDIFGTSFQQPAWPKIRQNAPLIGNADPTATRSRASCDTSAHRSRQHLRSTFTQRKPPGPGLPSTSTATSSSAGHPSQHPHVTRTARSPQRSPLPQRRLLLPSQGSLCLVCALGCSRCPLWSCQQGLLALNEKPLCAQSLHHCRQHWPKHT